MKTYPSAPLRQYLPLFPQEDDLPVAGGRTTSAGSWLVSLAVLSVMLLAGAVVLG